MQPLLERRLDAVHCLECLGYEDGVPAACLIEQRDACARIGSGARARGRGGCELPTLLILAAAEELAPCASLVVGGCRVCVCKLNVGSEVAEVPHAVVVLHERISIGFEELLAD